MSPSARPSASLLRWVSLVDELGYAIDEDDIQLAPIVT